MVRCRHRLDTALLALMLGLLSAQPAAAAQPLSITGEQILLASADQPISGAGIRYQRQLLGLYIDGEEHPGLFAYVNDNRYLVPLQTVIEAIGAELDDSGDVLKVITPAGTAVIDQQWLRRVDEQQLIFISALSEALMVKAEFDLTSYALRLRLPWWRSDSSAGSRTAQREAQFRPPSASLRNLRADLNFFHSDERSNVWSEYLAAGNLAGGLWQARAAQTPDGQLRPFDYYWLKSRESGQYLIGNSLFQLHPLLPVVEQTGVQALFSNRSLVSTDPLGLSKASGNRMIGSSARSITGSGEPGAIAELRVNGGVVDRVRVRLDGRFEFTDVDVSTSGYSQVKVLLLDGISGVLTETLDYSRRGGAGLLENGQSTLFVGLGAQGNPLDSRSDSRGTSAALQWRHGLGEHLTVELGSQHDGDGTSSQAATYLSFGANWYAGLSYADGPNVDSAEITLDGGKDDWEVSLSAREYDVDLPGQQARQWVRFGSYRQQISDRLTLGLAGRDSRTPYQDERYLLPTVSWTNGGSLSFSAWPNFDGKYRLDSRFSPSYKDNLRYTYEDGAHFVDYRHQTGKGYEYYGSFRDADNFAERYESGVIVYSEHRAFERLQAGAVVLEGKLGFNLQMDSRLLPGVYSRLRVSENGFGNAAGDYDQGLTVQWDLTFDFAMSGGRFAAADTSFGSANSAALTGPLLLDGEPLARADQVSRVVLVVDGVSHTAAVQGGHYYVEGLTPGVHRVSLDSRYLPIEMQPRAGQVFWVQLERAAATHVPFALEVAYAVAGKVMTRDGQSVSARDIVIIDESGAHRREVTSDQFGMYRADNLPPGRYRAVVRGATDVSLPFEVKDEFLFGLDLVLP